MSKVKQIISGCFRSLGIAEAYCRISSYIKSVAMQDTNPMETIRIALKGEAAQRVKFKELLYPACQRSNNYPKFVK